MSIVSEPAATVTRLRISFDLVPPDEARELAGTFSERLQQLCDALCRGSSASGVARIAVASYDAPTDMLKTFAASDEAAKPLIRYQRELKHLPSLTMAAATRRYRHLPDLQDPDVPPSFHTRALIDAPGSARAWRCRYITGTTSSGSSSSTACGRICSPSRSAPNCGPTCT